MTAQTREEIEWECERSMHVAAREFLTPDEGGRRRAESRMAAALSERERKLAELEAAHG